MRRFLVPTVVGLLAVGAACGGGDAPRAPLAVSSTPGAGVPDATTTTTTTTTTVRVPDPLPRIPRVGTSERPLAVLLVGDSIAITLEASLADALRRLEPLDLGVTRVLQGAAMGFGLTADLPSRYEGRTLPAAFPRYLDRWREYTATHRPDVVVAMLGTWDVVPRRVATRWLDPTDPEWRDEYRRRVLDATDALASSGARVAWLTEPCLDVANQPEPANGVLRGLRSALAQRGAAVVDLAASLCPEGRFTATLDAPDGTPVVVRRPDGVHFADTAPRALGPLVARLLAPALGLT